MDLLGTIPDERLLSDPELTQITESIGGEFLHAPGDVRRRVQHVMIGAMSSGHVVDEFRPGTLVITPGDREDIILAALSSNSLHMPPHGTKGGRPGGPGRTRIRDAGPTSEPLVVGVILARGFASARQHHGDDPRVGRAGDRVAAGELSRWRARFTR